MNGDSHSAGAELVENYAFADDDPTYKHLGRRPHPDCIPHTFGYKLAQTLNAGFYLDAESGSSNARILRTTQQFLQDNRKQDVFVLIGWSSWDREEWEHNKDYLQVTAGGTDSVPESMEEEYKEWVVKQTPEELKRKEQLWYDRIWDFHCELNDQNIRHVFFNSMNRFNDNRDWDINFIPISYSQWLTEQGFNTVENNSHYGADAHRAWGKYIVTIVNTQYIMTGKEQRQLLTAARRHSIITKVRKEFKGLRR